MQSHPTGSPAVTPTTRTIGRARRRSTRGPRGCQARAESSPRRAARSVPADYRRCRDERGSETSRRCVVLASAYVLSEISDVWAVKAVQVDWVAHIQETSPAVRAYEACRGDPLGGGAKCLCRLRTGRGDSLSRDLSFPGEAFIVGVPRSRPRCETPRRG
ncbi:hypothetical protein NOCA2140034 [metagenome]|uniref:Uncharacterized protein n=1 Tax=metagenome TaxID=256318 RepID=A0A2P2BWT2_9ZZZZ